MRGTGTIHNSVGSVQEDIDHVSHCGAASPDEEIGKHTFLCACSGSRGQKSGLYRRRFQFAVCRRGRQANQLASANCPIRLWAAALARTLMKGRWWMIASTTDTTRRCTPAEIPHHRLLPDVTLFMARPAVGLWSVHCSIASQFQPICGRRFLPSSSQVGSRRWAHLRRR